MNADSAIVAFFQDLAPKIIDLVVGYEGEAAVANYKGASHDFATEIDLSVEKLIVKEIRDRFPSDLVLAEEEHNGTQIDKGRTWIIDPICGTNNLGRGLRNFCTNIAIAEDGKLLASCVVDHSQCVYYWSVGNNQIYQNNKLFVPKGDDVGIAIEIDFGAMPKVSKEVKEKHTKATLRLLTETDYVLLSLNTSLSFAYIALGKIDGAINVANYPWDVSAASFLIQQSGGIITDLSGKPWSISSVGFIAAKNETVHAKLLDVYA